LIFAEKQRAEKKHEVWCELTVAEKQRAEKQLYSVQKN